MRFGLHIPSFTWSGGHSNIGKRIVQIAQLAEHGGFDRVSVMDHVWQISHIGTPDQEI